MHCPVCQHTSTRVVDSRLASDGMSVRRRRECEQSHCNYRFSTYEQMEMLDVILIKRDGVRQPYNRQKLIKGLKRSLEKRSYTDDEFQKMLQHIERDVQKERSPEITSEQLGEIVMKHLKSFDKVAYIRFASVYYSFDDLETFATELDKLSQKKRRSGKR